MAWLEGFSNRLKLTVSSDNVDSSLTDFPVMVHLSSNSGKNSFDATAVFDELGDVNQNKIAVTKNDGITQCPVEIEYWDATEEKAVLWTKIPTVYSTVDTDFYFYYDATTSGNTDHVGDIGDSAAQNVWDSNFKAVYHMAQPPPTNNKVLYAGEKSGAGDPATAATSFASVDCTGLTKANGTLVIELKCSDSSSIGNNQFEITSSAGPDSEEWSHDFTTSELSEIDTIYKTFYFPLSNWGTTGGELVVNQIDYIRWYAFGGITIYWQNARIIWPDGEEHILLDSTSNEIYAVSEESMTPTDLVDGKIGKAIDFDGVDDYFMTANANDVLNITTTLTLECIFKPTNTLDSGLTTNVGLMSRQHEPTGAQDTYGIFINPDGKLQLGSSGGNIQGTKVSWSNTAWWYITGTYNSSGLTGDLFTDGVKEVLTNDSYDAMAGGANSLIIAQFITTDPSFDGKIDEVRISNTVRADAWIKATYHSNCDNIVIFQQEEITTNWLGDWAQRIKLTIDHTKIDTTLVDFPINITLASGTGINNKDVTNLFNTLTSSGTVVFEDNFSTGLGEQWYDLNGTADYSSFYLKQNTDGAQAQTINHIQWGDIWEVTFRWKNHGSGSGNDQYHLYMVLKTGYHLRLYMRTYNSGDYWVQLIRNMGSDTTLHTNTDYNYYNERGNWFWVKMRRTLDNLKFKIWKDGDSETSWSYDGDVLNDTFATYGVIRSYAAGTTAAGVGLDDIVVTGNDSRNKKIAITTNDGVTQCPVEIERWSASYNEANLWTKVPLVKSDEDIILYLYYDPTQPDNTTYVGDTGDTPAQNVWDENFKAVWHMAQSPTTTLKDSISSANNGTSAGSMTTADLVDGRIGKAIDFDGTDDNIGCGSSTLLDDIGIITIECTFNAAGWGEGASGRIISKSDGANNYGWNVFINGAVGLKFGIIWGWDTTLGIWYTPDASISLDNWFYGVTQYDRSYGVGDKAIMYLNGISQTVITSQAPVGSIESDAAQNVSIGSRAATDREFEGIIDEIRISDIYRSPAWVKATYYSNWNDLITYGSEQDRPTHYYDGYVTEQGSSVSRTVRLYDRITGELISETTSAGSNGYYYLTTTVSGQHFIVAFDDDENISYNALILDKLLPRGIE